MFFPIGSNIPRMRIPWATLAWMLSSILVFFLVTWPELKEPLETTTTFKYAYVPADTHGFWTLFSYQFLHSSLAHLVSNLWYLAIFGWILESVLGSLPFAMMTLAAGAVAVIPEKIFQVNPDLPIVGCSGAVAFAMGAVAALYPWSRVRFWLAMFPLPSFPSTFFIPIRYLIYFWLILQVSGLAMSVWVQPEPIAYSTHLTGFALGLFLGLLLRPFRRQDFLDIELMGSDLKEFHAATEEFLQGQYDAANQRCLQLSRSYPQRLQVQEVLFDLALRKGQLSLADVVWKKLVPLYVVHRQVDRLFDAAERFRTSFGQHPPLELQEKIQLQRLCPQAPEDLKLWLKV